VSACLHATATRHGRKASPVSRPCIHPSRETGAQQSYRIRVCGSTAKRAIQAARGWARQAPVGFSPLHPIGGFFNLVTDRWLWIDEIVACENPRISSV